MKLILNILILFGFLISSRLSSAQEIKTEQRFQDLFITAGYSTAFGAALGAAFLGLSSNPSGKMRYIAVGASLGFIGGSVLGTYIVFFPMFTGRTQIGSSSPARGYEGPPKDRSLIISPVFNDRRLDSVQANWLIAKF
ncbi:MAG: hypothetical protein HYW48_01005 [Deltaproteobacteria bacterium]|nr:hypothetical protein [Deltaproteobacteria bacterium]